LHLGGGAHHDTDRFAGVRFEPRFQRLLHRGFGFAADENDIAAGDVGADVLEPQRLAHRLELAHRELAGAADIHCAEQGDEGGHRRSP
jgi:hypothetical protein